MRKIEIKEITKRSLRWQLGKTSGCTKLVSIRLLKEQVQVFQPQFISTSDELSDVFDHRLQSYQNHNEIFISQFQSENYSKKVKKNMHMLLSNEKGRGQ